MRRRKRCSVSLLPHLFSPAYLLLLLDSRPFLSSRQRDRPRGGSVYQPQRALAEWPNGGFKDRQALTPITLFIPSVIPLSHPGRCLVMALN